MSRTSDGARWVGYAEVAAAAAAWGTWGLFFRRINAHGSVEPALAIFIIFAILTIALLPSALHATWRTEHPRGWRVWGLVLIFGIADALNNVFYFSALSTTTVSVAVLTHY